jgi:hypothetical protein
MTQQIVDGDRYSVVYVRATEANPLPVNIGSATLSVTADGVEIKNDAGNPIPISDNGASLTVDSTALDSIDTDTAALVTDLAAVEVLLTSMDADTSAIAVDAAAIESLLTTIDADTGSIDGKIPASLTVTSTRLLVDGSGVTQPVSGTVNTLTGLDIPKHDNIALTYTGDNLTGVAYKVGASTVATLTLAYTGSRLDSVTKS